VTDEPHNRVGHSHHGLELTSRQWTLHAPLAGPTSCTVSERPFCIRTGTSNASLADPQRRKCGERMTSPGRIEYLQTN